MIRPEPIFYTTAGEFESWLERHAAEADEIWLGMHKKHTGIVSLNWEQAVDVALCFGWIDSQSRRIDDDRFMQRFTPRRPRSIWSKVNREKVEALIVAGRMRESGMVEVERAKADGRWAAAYDGMAAATVPDDLAQALEAAGLADAFQALSASSRYAILHSLQTAKRPETRARRVEKFTEKLAADR